MILEKYRLEVGRIELELKRRGVNDGQLNWLANHWKNNTYQMPSMLGGMTQYARDLIPAYRAALAILGKAEQEELERMKEAQKKS